MFFAETTNHRLTSEGIKQSCLTNCAFLVRHQRIHWGQNADSTNTRSLNFYSGPGYPPARATPTSPKAVCTVHVRSNTFLYRTHQYTVQGFDPSGSHTSILDVFIRVTDNTINYRVPINFDHEYFNIIPAIISTLPFLYYMFQRLRCKIIYQHCIFSCTAV